ncbi:uncharacterized protein LOC143877320 isoform X1 [Tasmannia lanceolata]|uniref:uncharacterized protein LOC143877320 isoform X1 n=1 Tax=Tasmannia lanceolata TaxID=3420 RepID=UPI004064047A
MPPRAAKKGTAAKKASPKITKPKNTTPKTKKASLLASIQEPEVIESEVLTSPVPEETVPVVPIVEEVTELEVPIVEEVTELEVPIVEEVKALPENEVADGEKTVVEEEVFSKSEVATEMEVCLGEEAKVLKLDEILDSKDSTSESVEEKTVVEEVVSTEVEVCIGEETKVLKLEELLDSKDPTSEAVDGEDETCEEPKEIDGGVNENEAVQMDEDLVAKQEIIEDGTGDDEGGEKVGDDDKVESDDEEDNEENEDLEDPSVYMHSSLTDGKKQKDFEIFVGGLSKEAVEDDLIKVFSAFGEIQSARIVKHPSTQKSKGFAFIRYATVDQAKKVLAELKDGTEVKGKRVGISASQDNDTLYMGNICKTWTKDNVLAKLKDYAVEQIVEIFLPEDSKNEGKNKGFALLEFSTHSDAMTAFQRLRKPFAIFGCDISAKVAFAQSSIHPSQEALSQVKTVYVEGLPGSWDEEKVKEHCQQYGEIDKVELSRNFGSAKRKDFGFIAFTSRESAIACVEGINSAQLGEGDIKVKANLAKPQNKGRLAKQGARGGFKVKKDGESTVEAGSSKMKGKAKSKGAEGKGRSKRKSGGGGNPSRPQGRVNEGKIGPFEDRQSKGQPFKGGKRGGRGTDHDNNAQPSKKARNNRNIRGGPNNDFGNQGNSRFGKPKGSFAHRPVAYGGPYTSGYGAPATSYQGHGYSANSGSKRRYSDMEPHAGYLEPAAKQGRDPYANGQRRAGGYDSHVRTGAGYVEAGPVLPPAYAPGYSSYAGYETGYGYPSSSGAVYPPHPHRPYY